MRPWSSSWTWRKEMACERVAPYSFTGTFTSQKVISPLHIARMPHNIKLCGGPPGTIGRHVARTWRETIGVMRCSREEVVMGAVPVQILRVIVWLCLVGSLFVQLGFAPLVAWEMWDSGAPLGVVVALAALLVLGVFGLQVV